MSTTAPPRKHAARIEALHRLAATQHGAVSLEQLRHIGLSERTVRRWASDGRLRRIHQGSYALPGAPVTAHQRLMAAVLAGQQGCLASHRAAAWLWGFSDEPFLEVIVPRNRRPRLEGVVVHHPLDHSKARPSVKDGIPVTNPLRTLVDLGATWEFTRVTDAVEQALISRIVTFRGLAREWRRVAKPGRNGSGVLRHILDSRLLGEKPPDSVLEVKAAPLFARFGLPRPEFQFHVVHDGRHVARVDFAYPERRLAIEFDGLLAHATAADLRRDLARQNRLVTAGWTVLRFTWADAIHEPERVAREIRRVLARPLAA